MAAASERALTCPSAPTSRRILIIGAGPIVIGQACEFDYSGAQACKALREEGYRVILVNSNPATIMTDPDMADAVYIEPINWQTVEKIIAKETPGRAAADHGRPDRAELRAGPGRRRRAGEVRRRADRRLARSHPHGRGPRAVPRGDGRDRAGMPEGRDRAYARAGAARSRPASAIPTIIRPSFTLGGTGGGIAYNREEFERDRHARPRAVADRAKC